MNYYLDTEFVESPVQPKFLGIKIGKPIFTIDLISIGIVSEDKREYYAISKEFDVDNAWGNFQMEINKHYPQGPDYNKIYWIRENVLKPIFDEFICYENKEEYRMREACVSNPPKINYKFTKSNFKKLLKKYGKSKGEIKNSILSFVRDVTPYSDPKFYAYYADYDWVVFCWIFGRMIDLPKGFPMYCRDLKQTLDEKGNPNIKHIKDMNKDVHNALSDAKFNMNLHEYLNNY